MAQRNTGMTPQDWNRATEKLVRLSRAHDRASAREGRNYLRAARQRLDAVREYLNDLTCMAVCRGDIDGLKRAQSLLVEAQKALARKRSHS